MAERPPIDDVDKLLAEQKAFEDRKQAVIDDLLRQKAEALKIFDDKLAKLGYHPNSKSKKSHHKQAPAEPAKAKQRA